MAIYAVGDIQGCFEPLRQLLERVRFDPAHDRLWCTGDLINRGPQSLETIRFIRGLGSAAVTVLGNHDFHLLEYISGGRGYGRDTFADILRADDRDELVDWLRHRPLIHFDAELGWCMVHAALHPRWNLRENMARAAEAEARLRGDDWQAFCHELHHTPFPDRDPEQAAERPYFAVAVFTRSRFCNAEGVFDWRLNEGAAAHPEATSWFDHAELAWRDECRVVYGHWAANGLVTDRPHVLGLDSGCVWGGALTIARLDDGGSVVAQQKCQSHQKIGD